MPTRYWDLGADKRLSDIVFAGSHDASITEGNKNAQTQNLDIAGQAAAGVRLFDLRILARAWGDGSVSLVGYHGSAKKAKTMTKMTSDHTQKTYNVKASKKMSAGTFGESLSSMLKQANKFVSDTNEFLIFKFDKCTNWQLIADYCVNILGDTIYKPIGIPFGKLMLNDLKHKVVCVFNDSDLKEVKGLDDSDGILGFRNLKAKKGDPKSYVANYSGMQYFGKGGTDPKKIWKTQSGKMSENEAKQKKLMKKMAAVKTDPHAPDVLGMMYWTSTGALSSIESRNKVMWTPTGVHRMEELWRSGLEASVKTQMEQDEIKSLKYGGGVRRMKAFFPNIVMIDFADPDKCKSIYQLNKAADDRLVDAYKKYTA